MENILKDLIKLINDSSSHKVKIVPSMLFLLGDQLEEEFEEEFDKTENTSSKRNYNIAKFLSGIHTKDKSLSEDQLRKVYIAKHDISERLETCVYSGTSDDEFDMTVFEKGLELLCKKHNIPIDGIDYDQMLKELIFLYFFHTTTPEYIFVTKDIRKNTDYVSWPEKELELATALTQVSCVFISGEPATGKSQLIKNYLCKKKDEYYYFDYCQINADNNAPLSDSIVSFQYFIDPQHIEHEITLSELASILPNKGNDFHLVIHRPILTTEDISFIKRNLLLHSCKVIITTRTAINCPKSRTIKLSQWPNELLKKIFDKSCPQHNFDNRDLNKLFDHLGHNPYLADILGKSLSKDTPDDYKIQIRHWYTQVLNRSGHKIHSGYENNGANSSYPLPTVIGRILFPYNEDIFNDTLLQLSIWCKYPTSIHFLESIGKFKREDIDKALKYNLLVFVNKTASIVKMPLILDEAIRFKHPFSLTDAASMIYDLLERLETGHVNTEPRTYIYSTIQSIIYYYHEDLTEISATNKENFIFSFESWTLFLTLFMEKCFDLGEHKLVLDVLHMLFKGRNNKNVVVKFKGVCPDVYITFWEILIDYRAGTSIIDTLDRLIDCLNNCPLELLSYVIQKSIKFILEQHLYILHNNLLDEFINPNCTIKLYNPNSISKIVDFVPKEWCLYYKMCIAYLDFFYYSIPSLEYARIVFKEIEKVNDIEIREQAFIQNLFYEILLYMFQLKEHLILPDINTIKVFKAKLDTFHLRITEQIFPGQIIILYLRIDLMFSAFFSPYVNENNQRIKGICSLIKSISKDQIKITPEEYRTLKKVIQEAENSYAEFFPQQSNSSDTES